MGDRQAVEVGCTGDIRSVSVAARLQARSCIAPFPVIGGHSGATTLRPMSEQRSDDDVAALRAEVDRLRQLVGPSEQSYADLRLDLLAASDAAKGAEAAEGVYRGRVNELEAALARARQDQDHFQRAVFNTLRNSRDRVGRAVRSRLL